MGYNSEKNKKRELDMKSKLLHLQLDSQVKVVFDVNESVDKRKKALDKIFKTFEMTLKPFLEGESEENILGCTEAIKVYKGSLYDLIENMETVEILAGKLNKVVESLKYSSSTCRMNVVEVSSMFGYDFV